MTPQLRNITTVTLRLRCEKHETDLDNDEPHAWARIVQQSADSEAAWHFDLGNLSCSSSRALYGEGNTCREHWRVWYHPTQGS